MSTKLNEESNIAALRYHSRTHIVSQATTYLRRAGIHTVGDLLKLKYPKDIYNIHGIGEITGYECLKALSDNDLWSERWTCLGCDVWLREIKRLKEEMARRYRIENRPKCPVCGVDGPFEVDTTGVVRLDGYSKKFTYDLRAGLDSRCVGCDFVGKTEDFKLVKRGEDDVGAG